MRSECRQIHSRFASQRGVALVIQTPQLQAAGAASQILHAGARLGGAAMPALGVDDQSPVPVL